ncbi:MAG: glycosyltransferase family 2 protein, partial [Firmicutes bacterium]|nr:glycosyltransferase family 2 protein [Bacillota bacterium]
DPADYWAPCFLSQMAAVLDSHPRAGFAAANMRILPEEPGTDWDDMVFFKRQPALNLEEIKLGNPLASSSQVLLRTAAYASLNRRVPPQDLAQTDADDEWLVWLALLNMGYDGLYRSQVLSACRQSVKNGRQHRMKKQRDEDLVVQEWFPRLGFSTWDQRRVYGLRAFDALHSAWTRREIAALSLMLQDLPAFWAARRFRKRHT